MSLRAVPNARALDLPGVLLVTVGLGQAWETRESCWQPCFPDVPPISGPSAQVCAGTLQVRDGRYDLHPERLQGLDLVHVRHVEDEVLYTGLAHLPAKIDHIICTHSSFGEVGGA